MATNVLYQKDLSPEDKKQIELIKKQNALKELRFSTPGVEGYIALCNSIEVGLIEFPYMELFKSKKSLEAIRPPDLQQILTKGIENLYHNKPNFMEELKILISGSQSGSLIITNSQLYLPDLRELFLYCGIIEVGVNDLYRVTKFGETVISFLEIDQELFSSKHIIQKFIVDNILVFIIFIFAIVLVISVILVENYIIRFLLIIFGLIVVISFLAAPKDKLTTEVTDLFKRIIAIPNILKKVDRYI